MLEDFREYNPNFPINQFCHMIFSGQEKETDKRVIISTWQSVYNNPSKYFKDFGAIIVDEAHEAKADSLKGICQKAIHAPFRFGFTGTLDDLKYHRLIIEGLCGPVFRTTNTKHLMDNKIVSELNINCLVLKYNDEVRNNNKKFKYQDEMKFIVNNSKRNKFIANLTKSINNDKNILILTAYKNHINLLKKELEQTGREVLVVTGDTDPDERKRVRQYAQNNNGVIILATYGVYYRGISIKNLQYVILATNYKSMIRILQTLGRGLRLDGKENKVTALDIIDDFGFGKRMNYIVQHFIKRVKIYALEQFSYKIKNINIK